MYSYTVNFSVFSVNHTFSGTFTNDQAATFYVSSGYKGKIKKLLDIETTKKIITYKYSDGSTNNVTYYLHRVFDQALASHIVER